MLQLNHFILLLWLAMLSCGSADNPSQDQHVEDVQVRDSLALVEMINTREQAMITKDLATAMGQFVEEITWINSQGYYFAGINEVRKFHHMLAENDSLDYMYQAGQPKIRLLDSQNALAYYGWKMFWFQKVPPMDTVNREIGLMTLSARKMEGEWKWFAVTNQHTPWFYEKIEPVTIH